MLLVAFLALAGCASPTVESPDAPIGADVALVGETKVQRSMRDYDAFGLAGVDKRQRFMPWTAVKRDGIAFYRVPSGKHTLYVRVLATAHRGFPGLRDDTLVFENVELEGGRAYVITGQRVGEEFDVWIEDRQTREHITSALRIKPRRQGIPVLIPTG